MDMRTADEPLGKGYRIVQLLLLLVVCALFFLSIAHYSQNGFFSNSTDNQTNDHRRPRPVRAPEVLHNQIPVPEFLESLPSEPAILPVATTSVPRPSVISPWETSVPDSPPPQAAVYQSLSTSYRGPYAGQTQIAVVDVRELLRLHLATYYMSRPSSNEYRAVTTRIKAAVANVANTQGLWLVLDSSAQGRQSTPVIYSESDFFNITDLVIKELGLTVNVVAK